MIENPHLVSVMMPVHNAERYVAGAVESLQRQTHTAWELLVVDDGSTDGTFQIVSEIQDRRISLARQANAGEATARNRALEDARGEFLAFLDADDRFLPDHLSQSVDYLLAHPEDDAVYTDGYHIDEDGKRTSKLSSRRRGPFTGDIFEEVVRASDVFGPPICVVLRRRLVEGHGLAFDPKIVIGPDWDFFVRASEVGRFGYLDLSTCEYRVHGASITYMASDRRRRESLARCREKAIQTNRFEDCSRETRTAVFYDLLVDQLFDRPEDQNRVVHTDRFLALPGNAQARLLRLIARQALSAGRSRSYRAAWLRSALENNPLDLKTWVLFILPALGPRVSQAILRLRAKSAKNRTA